MDSSSPRAVDREFLRQFYGSQWRRFRMSRNQDWAALGILVTLIAASTAVQYAQAPQWLQLLCSLLVVLFSLIGLRILHLHEIVKRHATKVCKDIERYFGVLEDGAEPLVVGHFKYDSKAAYAGPKGIGRYGFWSFFSDMICFRNVQCVMGVIYLGGFAFGAALFILRVLTSGG